MVLALLSMPPLARPVAAAPPAAALDSLAALEAAGRWVEAERVAGELIAALEREPRVDSLAIAGLLVRQAHSGRAIGRLSDGRAVRAAERAVAVSERLRPAAPFLHCEALSLAALLQIDLVAGDSALARVRRALAVAEGMRPRSDSLIGALHFREGQAHRVRDDPAAGIVALRRALESTERRLGPEAPGVGVIAFELGRAFTRGGEEDSARAWLERAIGIGRRHAATSTVGLESALSSLGSLERLSGNLARAVGLATEAYELYVARRGAAGRDATSYLSNVAVAYYTLGDFARARPLLEETLKARGARLPATHRDMLLDRITLAMTCLRTGDRARARLELDRVDSLSAIAPPEPTVVAYAATVRTGLDLEEHRFAEARRRLLDAARRAPEWRSSRVDLAARLFETVRTDRDAALLDSLGGVVDGWADSAGVARVKNWTRLLDGRALAEARLGRRDAAWARAVEAESVARERFEWEIQALPDREALLHDEDATDPSQTLVELADPARSEQVRAAWEAIVRRRGAVRELVGSRRPASTADTAVAGAHARWVAAARSHARRLVAGDFDADAADARARFESSLAAVADAERRYAALAPDARPAAPTLARVRASLRPHEALVAYVRVERSLEPPLLDAFVARGDGSPPRLVRLGPESSVAAAAADWLALLSTPPPDERRARVAEERASAAGARVRRAVWEPLVPALGGASRVYVVAAGALRDLPWLALPAGGGRYLAEVGPTVHVLTAERDLLLPPASAPATGLLAVGDPDFGGAAGAGAGTGAATTRRLPGLCGRVEVTLPPLPGAREEARGIARGWTDAGRRGEPLLLLGADATERRFKELAVGRRVIHVATHGVLARDSCATTEVATRGVGGVGELGAGARAKSGRPARRPATPAPTPAPASPWIGRDAWLAFAGANRASASDGDENEGWLTADEVTTLDLRGTDRVVLSACQSGVAERWSEEAVLGMRRAFHLAGARCVVASLWAVADESTRAWMEAFHASDAPAAGDALRDAARAVLAQRRAAGRPTHPFFWAAFTATGD